MDHVDRSLRSRRAHRRDLPEDVRRQRVRHLVAYQVRDASPARVRRCEHREHHVDRRCASRRVLNRLLDDQGCAESDDVAARKVVWANQGQRCRPRPRHDTLDCGLGRNACRSGGDCSGAAFSDPRGLRRSGPRPAPQQVHERRALCRRRWTHPADAIGPVPSGPPARPAMRGAESACP